MIQKKLKIRRALLSVSDKEELVPLAQCLKDAGAELVATGQTARLLQNAGLTITPIEQVSGSPEAFQGRMKTLSFPVCSGILYRRKDPQDLVDLEKFGIAPIDCVVVNFYPFEQALTEEGITRDELIEKIDVGGPTLVRAAAKNAPDVLVLTGCHQYKAVMDQLQEHGAVSFSLVEACAEAAWEKVLHYDSVIASELGERKKLELRYGENPHQKGVLEWDPQSPLDWGGKLSAAELSYNNILDLSSAYALASDLIKRFSDSTAVVIVKHNNPCGVALVPRKVAHAQKVALTRAWEGDPVSAFGGVLVFTDPLEQECADWLAGHFVELVSAPQLEKNSEPFQTLLARRKNLKAVQIHRFGEVPRESVVWVPGGRLRQTTDLQEGEPLKSITGESWSQEQQALASFGVLVCKALKSNAIALVRQFHPGAFQLVGAGQGQPNRVDALKSLAIPRAQATLRASEGSLDQCMMISDAFFPFRDTVDEAHAAGIRWIVQPGGSIKDSESIEACHEHGISMALTGVRHFKH
ncbi:MAG: bifunctional phosphoribosylaminoimidazolecarboxamide formyltransferase/IMP cyclohydrolase [Bdellovibrionia bacterium]